MKTKKGFTIVELLVVVAIIALMSSIVITALTAQRNKAKDARIQSELHGIKLALEEYNVEHGGYPNPGPGSWCIGANNCVLAGNSITSILAFKQNGDFNNLAAVNLIPAFEEDTFVESPTITDDAGRDNKGYVYVSCTTPNANGYCDYDSAGVIFPSYSGIKSFNVGSYLTSDGCTIDECDGTTGNTCGTNNNEACSNFCSTNVNATNYDVDGTGSCNISTIYNELSYPYCSDSSASGYSYDSDQAGWCAGSGKHYYGSSIPSSYSNLNGTGTCINITISSSYGSGNSGSYCDSPAINYYCAGSVSIMCSSYSDQTQCNSQPGNVCSWGGETSPSCTGSINISCSGRSSEWDCTSLSGCSWTYDDFTGSYSCTGTPSVSCSDFNSDSSNCSLYGCSYSGGSPGSCNSTGASCSSFNQSTCSSVSGCYWTY